MDNCSVLHIPASVDMERLVKALHIEGRSEKVEMLKPLVDEALKVAVPKAVYRVAYIDDKGDDYIVADGTRFDSRVLRVNIGEAHRVIVYVVTCGQEIEKWSLTKDDILESYWADNIKEAVLYRAAEYFDKFIRESLALEKTAVMNPGSLADWPVTQQKDLFGMLGNVKEQIGVELTDSCLMIPFKTVSGLMFPTGSGFQSCQLCPRKSCVNRRAPYEPGLYAERFAAGQGK